MSVDPMTEAHNNLDLTGNILANGANISGDFAMRFVMSARERLDRHAEPKAGTSCDHCGHTWPCPDALTEFKTLGVDPYGDDDEDSA